MKIDEQAKPIKSNILFRILAVVLCLRHVLLLIGLGSIASKLFLGVYGLTGLLLATGVIKKLLLRQKMTSLVLFVVGLAFLLWAMGSVFFYHRSLFEKNLTFFLVFPLMISMEKIDLTPDDGRFYLRLIVAVAVTLVLMAFPSSSYRDGLLLLYTLNGNQCGLLYMMIFLCVFLYQSFYKRRVTIWILLAGLLYGCIRTESRTALLSCILIVVVTWLLNHNPAARKQTLAVTMCVYIMLPFVSALLVSWLGADFEILGASAWTGREDIWPHVLEVLGQSPFGLKVNRVVHNFYGEDLGAHNTWLTVAWNYSVPFVIVFFLSLFNMGKKMIGDLREKGAPAMIGFYMAGLLHMTFESSMIVGALDYSLYFLMAMMAGSALKKEQTEKLKEAQNQDGKQSPGQHYRSGL